MSVTDTGITILETLAHDAGVVLRVANAHADKVVQCYVNGELVARQSIPAPTWTCRLAPLAATDVVSLLAADVAEASSNLFESVADETAPANRLRIRLPQTIADRLPDDRWRVYLGGAGEATATTEAYTGAFYLGGRRACGFGSHFGSGLGYDAHEAAGFGAAWGLGEFAFDCECLQWLSEPLPPGAYPVRVTCLDAAGAESPGWEGVVTLASYARPARDLTVVGYAAATDTLTFSFTESEDIPYG